MFSGKYILNNSKMDKVEIQDKFIGNKFDIDDITKKLSNIFGIKAKCYDTKIDDIIEDDEEDEYLMKSCFEFENSSLEIYIYHCNNSGVITCLSFNN